MRTQDHSIDTERPPKFGFNLDVLQPGDILLSADNTKVSKIIARTTRGPYSHAMLYVGNSIIHAMTDGVYSKNPQRYLKDDLSHIAAYRVNPSSINYLDIEAIIRYARNQIGALYSIPQAVISRGPEKKILAKTIDESGKQFCSRLVAQAYSSVGIQLVDDPNYCTPNDLANSNILSRIDNATKQYSNQELAISETKDFNAEVQRRTFQWLNKVRNLAARKNLGLIAVQNDVLTMLYKNPGYDQVVSNYVIDSRYDEYYNVDRTQNPYRYNSEIFLTTYKEKEILINLLLDEIENLKPDLVRHTHNYNASISNYSQLSHLRYMQITHDLSEKLYIETMQRRKTLIEVSKALEFPLQPF